MSLGLRAGRSARERHLRAAGNPYEAGRRLLDITARKTRFGALGCRRSGPVDPLGNTTTGGEMQRCELDVGLVITLGGRRP